MLAERLCLAVPHCANVAKDVIFVLDNENGNADLDNAKEFIKKFSTDVSLQRQGINAGLVVAGDNGTQVIWGRKTHKFLPEIDGFDSGYDTVLTKNLGPLTLDDALFKASNFTGRTVLGRPIPRDIILLSDRTVSIPENFTGNFYQINSLATNAESSATPETTYITDDATLVVTQMAEQFCDQTIETCIAQPIDVAIMMDGSGSLGMANFIENIEFIKEFSQALSLSANGVHLSVVQFSSAGLETVEVPFTYDTNNVVDGLNDATYQDGFTHTGQGMVWTWNEVLNKYNRAEKKVIIVMTDGKAMDPVVVEEAGEILKQHARVYAVGIGKDVSLSNLRALATDPETLTPNEDGSYPETSFMASYSTLSKLTQLIGDAACSNSFA